ncbi:hypothetical protein U1Q18_017799 [Sarracenia purpurea var. burkii]
MKPFSFASLVTSGTKVGSSEVVGVGGDKVASPSPLLCRPCFLHEIRSGFPSVRDVRVCCFVSHWRWSTTPEVAHWSGVVLFSSPALSPSH